MIRLRTLGGLALEGEGAPMLQRRPLALLAVLAGAGDLGISRDKLLAYFWPESDEDRGRNVLRQLLHSIRRDVREPELFVGTTELRLNPELLVSDLAEFDRASNGGDWEATVALYRGPFLDGFYLSNAAGFENWKESERARLARRFADAAEQVARRAAAVGDHAKAIGMWQRLAVGEPLNSRVAIELVRTMAAAGDLGGALKHARVHEALLREDLGATAPGEMISLVHQYASQPAFTGKSGFGPDTRIDPPTRNESSPAVARDEHYAPTLAQPTFGMPPAWRFRLTNIRWAIFGVLLIGVAIVALANRRADSPVDPTTLLVLPSIVPSGVSDEMVPHGTFDKTLRQTVTSWRDLRLADDLRVRDAVTRSPESLSLSEIVRVARSAGAGRMIRTNATVVGDSISWHATLYDVQTRRVLADAILPTDRETVLGPAIEALVRELLRSRSGLVDVRAHETALGTRSAVAWQAFDSAQRSIEKWDLLPARRLLTRAVDHDREFALANLLLAQVLAWLPGDNASETADAAARALLVSAALNEKDRLRAVALAAAAKRDFYEACGAYRRVLAIDSLDFAAWYGLAECQSRDTVVVTDPRSPSGWRFRSSYHAAVQAYSHALRLQPSFGSAFGGNAFSRLSALLFTEPTRYRAGVSVGDGDTSMFGAFPAIDADTLAFLPVRIADLRISRLKGARPGRLDAIRRNRALLRQMVARWATADSSNFDALEAFALAQETNGEIGTIDGRAGALTTLRRARALARTAPTARRLRLAVAEVRLLLKSGAVEDARALADSVVDSAEPVDPRNAADLAVLAALTGRVERAAAFLEQSASEEDVADEFGRSLPSPTPVTASALRLLVYASFGGPLERTRTAYVEFERRLAASVEVGRRTQLRQAHLRRPVRLAYDVLVSNLGAQVPLRDDPLVRIHAAVSRSDAAVVRAIYDSLVARRVDVSPSEIAPDQWFQEATVLLAIGDSSRAASVLETGLDALPTASVNLLSSVPTAAALGRAMALRALLSTNPRDAAEREEWRRRATILWAHGDQSPASRVASGQSHPD
jgi:DNA-binding SARP family transcriptional activator/tetratricopeptide (TPR) repeat protein